MKWNYSCSISILLDCDWYRKKIAVIWISDCEPDSNPFHLIYFLRKIYQFNRKTIKRHENKSHWNRRYFPSKKMVKYYYLNRLQPFRNISITKQVLPFFRFILSNLDGKILTKLKFCTNIYTFHFLFVINFQLE